MYSLTPVSKLKKMYFLLIGSNLFMLLGVVEAKHRQQKTLKQDILGFYL